jgi:hypothetical protein
MPATPIAWLNLKGNVFGARFARPKNIRKDPLRLSAKPILVFPTTDHSLKSLAKS